MTKKTRSRTSKGLRTGSGSRTLSRPGWRWQRGSSNGLLWACGLRSKRRHSVEVEKPWSEQSPQALRAPSEPGTWFWGRSWSPDGRSLAGDLQRSEGGYSGIAVYSLALKRCRRVRPFGAFVRWLRDSRRLLFLGEDKVHLIDSQSGKVRELLSGLTIQVRIHTMLA